MQPTITSHIRKGLIIAAVLIILNIIAQLMHQSFESWHRLLFIVVFVLAVIISSIIFKKQSKQNLSYNILFTHNFKTVAVIISVFFIYLVLSVYVLFPSQMDFLINETIQQASKQVGKSAQIQEQSVITKKVIVSSFLAGSLLLQLITGALASLLGAAIAKQIK